MGGRTRRWRIALFVGTLALAVAAAIAQTQVDAPIGALLTQLGDPDYQVREQATQQLIARGPSAETQLRAALDAGTDPEVQHRLRYVLTNLHPPASGVLIVSASPTSGLLAGDVVTHVNSRAVSADGELTHALANAQFGATLRVRRTTGTLEVGPVQRDQVQGVQTYAAPRGERFAQVVRLLHAGLAEQALAELTELDQERPVAADELGAPIRAVILHLAGQGAAALELMRGLDDWASPFDENDKWTSPSRLDWVMGMKAPYQLEWDLTTRAGPALQSSSDDLDLRMQRVLIPAGAYAEALTRAAALWWQRLKMDDPSAEPADRIDNHVAGNMLAVVGWMLHELGLRSECCRLIEPRSVILRSGRFGPQKWVRVDTDAWLPFFRGDDKAALDLFFEHGLSVLENPPKPPLDVIRNPQVAARLALFLYQFPDDPRVPQVLEAVAPEGHPAAAEYVHWMLMAIEPRNCRQIGRDLQTLLPRLSGPAALDAARAVALLEYVEPAGQREVMQAARARLFESPDIEDRDLWVALVDALADLRADRANEALRKLTPFEKRAEVAMLVSTARFRSAPPAAAQRGTVLANPLLAAPLGTTGKQWLVLAHDRRLFVLDDEAGTTTPVAAPTPAWFPSPIAWPWLGHDPHSGRSWVYARRRVIEVRADASFGLKLNIASEDISAFDRVAGQVFGRLVEAVEAEGPLAGGEAGEFLSGEVRAHHELTIDPELRELGLMKALPDDPRLIHLALRGGPHLLIEPGRDKVWSGRWLADKLGLPEPVSFLAQATAPAGTGTPPAAIVWLFSDVGLLRFDTGAETLQRIALPGPQPFPEVIPENAPYQRRDPAQLYCALRPEAGGDVFRIDALTLRGTALDIKSLAVPLDYYRLRTRGELRSQINGRFEELGLQSLNRFCDAVIEVTTRPGLPPPE